MTDDICGHPTTSGEPCQIPASRDDEDCLICSTR